MWSRYFHFFFSVVHCAIQNLLTLFDKEGDGDLFIATSSIPVTKTNYSHPKWIIFMFTSSKDRHIIIVQVSPQ